MIKPRGDQQSRLPTQKTIGSNFEPQYLNNSVPKTQYLKTSVLRKLDFGTSDPFVRHA